LTDQLHDLQLQQSTLSAAKQTARQTTRTLDRKSHDLQTSLDSISIDEEDLTILKRQIADTTTSLSTAQEEFTHKSHDTQISHIEVKISTVDEDIKTIQTELTSTSAQSEFRAKIDVLKTDLAKKSQSQKTLMAANAERFKGLVWVELTSASVDSQINVLLRGKQEDLEEAERFADNLAREITQFDAKQTNTKELLRDKRKEKNEAYGKVMRELEEKIEDFPREVKVWEKEVVDFRELVLWRERADLGNYLRSSILVGFSGRCWFRRRRNMFVVCVCGMLVNLSCRSLLREYTPFPVRFGGVDDSLKNISLRRRRRRRNYYGNSKRQSTNWRC
jgi:hypothetical protein